MPNLNYDVPQDVPQEQLDIKILRLIQDNSRISTDKIAEALGVSSKTIKRHIKKMENIQFIGSGYSGHWEINSNKD